VSSLPAQRLRARLLAPERRVGVVGSLLVLTPSCALVGVRFAGHDHGAASSLIACVAGLFVLYAALHADPRRAFAPRTSPSLYVRRQPLLLAAVGGALLIVASTAALRRGQSDVVEITLRSVAALLVVLVFAALVPRRVQLRPGDTLSRLVTDLSEELTEPPSALYRCQERLASILLPLAILLWPLASSAAAAGVVSWNLAANALFGLLALVVVALIVSELVAVALGLSVEPDWRARSWYNERFSCTTNQPNLGEPTPSSFGMRVECGRLWIALDRWNARTLSLWPRGGSAFADGVVEAYMELPADGVAGVAARIGVDHPRRPSCYVGWLARDGRAGIVLARDERHVAPDEPTSTADLDLYGLDVRELAHVPAGSVAVKPLNRVRLLALGQSLRLEINGQVVARARSDALTSGHWGIFAGANDAPTTVAFDTVAIVELERQASIAAPRHVPSPASSTRPAPMG
jgi:hypothetical protein